MDHDLSGKRNYTWIIPRFTNQKISVDESSESRNKMVADFTCHCRLQIKISMDVAGDQPLKYDVKIFVVGAENLFSLS